MNDKPERRRVASLVFQGTISTYREILSRDSAVRECVEFLRSRARSLNATPGLNGRAVDDAADAIELLYRNANLARQCIDTIKSTDPSGAEALIDAVIEEHDAEKRKTPPT